MAIHTIICSGIHESFELVHVVSKQNLLIFILNADLLNAILIDTREIFESSVDRNSFSLMND